MDMRYEYKQMDKMTESIIIYSKYLKYNIEYRQNMSIIPISCNDEDRRSIVSDDNALYKQIMNECVYKLECMLGVNWYVILICYKLKPGVC